MIPLLVAMCSIAANLCVVEEAGQYQTQRECSLRARSLTRHIASEVDFNFTNDTITVISCGEIRPALPRIKPEGARILARVLKTESTMPLLKEY